MLPRVGQRLPYVGGGRSLRVQFDQIISVEQPVTN